MPEGFEVTSNPWISQRDMEIYGEDSEIFRPGKWLEDPERAKEMEKYDFTWGFGTRVCLGKNIALMELYKVPVQVGCYTTHCLRKNPLTLSSFSVSSRTCRQKGPKRMSWLVEFHSARAYDSISQKDVNVGDKVARLKFFHSVDSLCTSTTL